LRFAARRLDQPVYILITQRGRDHPRAGFAPAGD